MPAVQPILSRLLHCCSRQLTTLLMAVVLMLGLSSELWAQDEENAARGTAGSTADAETIFQDWLFGQRDLMSALDAFAIRAEVDHSVATPSGERIANYGILFTRPENGEQTRGALRYFILDGDSLDVSERRRVDRILSSMMSEDVGPLLNGLTMPTRLLSRVRAVEAPVRMEREGRKLIRYFFELQPPSQERPPMQRPGVRPGVRPGFQGPGRRGPAGGIRQGNPMEPGGPDVRRPRISVFIEEETERLVMTRIQAVLPGERVLTAETTFQRLQGLDLPLTRNVSGDLPMRRRLRTVTVTLDHQTRFMVERLSLSER